ncbi:hypothetical protein [Streptomyces bottropensis]|uniref:hypothetical protein n=1 Tax=Streptomyces bottropensis TaxID=42235 RepID=UPI003680A3C5
MWDELFAAMTRDRDLAAVLLYVSSGPRASELLGVTRGDVDWAKQLIYVVTKGTDDREAVPASPLDPARPTAHCREPMASDPNLTLAQVRAVLRHLDLATVGPWPSPKGGPGGWLPHAESRHTPSRSASPSNTKDAATHAPTPATTAAGQRSWPSRPSGSSTTTLVN